MLLLSFSFLNLQVVNGIEIYSMKIDSKVTSRFARNVITSRAVNRGNVSKEVFFDVELPKTAFITNFSMCVIFTVLLKKTKKSVQIQLRETEPKCSFLLCHLNRFLNASWVIFWYY